MGGGSSGFKACESFFQIESGKAAFAKFVEGGNWKSGFQNRDGMDSLLVGLSEYEMTNVLHPKSWSDGTEVDQEKGEEEGQEEVKGQGKEQDEDQEEVKENVKESIPTRQALLAVVFPKFLASSHYESWVDLIISESSLSETGRHRIHMDIGTRVERLDAVFQAKEITLDNILDQAALASVDQEELDNALGSAGVFLTELITAVENLPFCVTVSTAREDRRNFPLVYVNKAFEAASGYSRDEIVGKNCKFLQSIDVEKESIERLVQALSSAQPCKVALTNVTKQGDAFTNLLALKPVFAENGDYSYVVGVQYVTSNAPIISRDKDILLVEDLLSILPNMLGLRPEEISTKRSEKRRF